MRNGPDEGPFRDGFGPMGAQDLCVAAASIAGLRLAPLHFGRVVKTGCGGSGLGQLERLGRSPSEVPGLEG